MPLLDKQKNRKSDLKNRKGELGWIETSRTVRYNRFPPLASKFSKLLLNETVRQLLKYPTPAPNSCFPAHLLKCP